MIKEREMKNMTMQEAFDKAITNKENFNADGSVNWNFIDADVYMDANTYGMTCLLYTSPSPRDRSISRMPSSA